ncbi:MAG: DUF882 domain-containing protein [Hyphomicrobiaceae bacterium]
MHSRFRLLAAVVLVVGALAGHAHIVSTGRAGTESERVLSLYNIHNGERLSVVYKRDGAYVPEALEKLNWIFRDWRLNEATKMDPQAYDILWEVYTELGSKEPISIISGYRSSRTNERLRKSGGGQAKHSQHILGKALDVSFPDVPVKKLRYSALVRERGGVGYYPTSAIPFVHIDTGRVRMWPRMARHELALLFPSGHSKYVPDDGRPITLSDVERARKKYTELAQSIEAFHQFRATAHDRVLVASLDQDAGGATPEPKATLVAAEPKATVVAPEPKAAVRVASASRVARAKVPETSGAALLAADDDMPMLDGPVLKPAAEGGGIRLASLTDIVPPVPVTARRPATAAVGLTGGGSVAASATPSPFGSLTGLITTALLAMDDGSASPEVELAATSAERASGEMLPPVPREETGEAFINRKGWATAPEYDDDHPSELSYRAFPIGPLLTERPDIDDPVLARLSHPNLRAAHALIGGDGGAIRLQFKPGLQFAEMLWADSFSDHDVAKLLAAAGDTRRQGRPVRTASQ